MSEFQLTPPVAAKKSKSKKPARLTRKGILKGANPEQAEAIQHGEGPLGVFAGAGSGKTRVLTHRIAMLVLEGANPSRILAVTFSKKAAMEMEERVHGLGVHDARVGTWHSLALQILREEGMVTGWTIDDKDRAKLLLKMNVLGYKGMNWNGADLGCVTSFIGFCKSQLWLPNSTEAKSYAETVGVPHDRARYLEAYRRYEHELQDNRLLTFDCMLLKAALLLSANADVRERWASRWDYVLQDEAQDASPAQMSMARSLANVHRNYMVVGDPAQSIFGFRGSRPEAIMNFQADWDGASVVTMARNYRCGSAIVECANEAIRPCECRLPSDLIAEGGWEGGVSHWDEPDLDAEARRVVTSCKDNHANGRKWEEHTVLFRTNAQSRALEEAFLEEKVPYLVVGGTNFYERKEVKDLLAYLRAATGRDTEASVRRCANAPFRFLGAKTIDKILGFLGKGTSVEAITNAAMVTATADRMQRRQVQSLADWTDTLERVAEQAASLPSDDRTVGDLIDELERATGYIEWLKKDQGEEGIESSHVANVKELIRVASRFATVDEFLDFIEETTRKAAKAAKETGGRVLLMSIHRSKGLEWPFVFVVGCSEGILPHPRGDQEEERRLFYVALTRAAEHCYLSSPRVLALRGGIKEVDTSIFVRELMPLLHKGE